MMAPSSGRTDLGYAMKTRNWTLLATVWALTGCTVIAVEGNHNHIRDAGGHGSAAVLEPDSAPGSLERWERGEKAVAPGQREQR